MSVPIMNISRGESEEKSLKIYTVYIYIDGGEFNAHILHTEMWS